MGSCSVFLISSAFIFTYSVADSEGDFYHTLLVTELRGNEILVSAHSNDVYNRPLSAYDAPLTRFLHIEGVRFETDEDDCFEGLIQGESLPSM